LLDIRDLRVSYGRDLVLNGIDLQVERGETLAVVGESGTGKTTLGLSIMRLAEARVQGSIRLNGTELSALPEGEMRRVRGKGMGMVFQNVHGVLNPVFTVLYQVMEPMVEHGFESEETARDRAARLLAYFGLPEHRMSAYPHQLSSGEQQRVLTAMALANDPEFLILDEPLSSLDAGSRFELGKLLKETAKRRTSLIFTHDLDTAAKLADRIAMLYGGRILEMGTARDVLLRPRHPYTRALIRAYPNMSTAKDLQGIKGNVARSVGGCPFHPRCTQALELCRRSVPELRVWDGRTVACHRGGVITLLQASNLTKAFGSRKAVNSVDLEVGSGETVALVGQSGSGKTTLARTLMGLYRADEGELFLEGEPVSERGKDFYRRVQMVFQNPGESLSHRLSVLEAVREPLDVQDEGTREQREAKALRVLGEVELPQSHEFVSKYPHQLSGGELQRVAIARALVLDPELLIADEPTTFLDASVQAKVLKLLLDLQEERGLSMLFITHDIAVARKVSDRIAIMLDGRIIEKGATGEVLEAPHHQYTQSLLKAAPALDSRYPRETIVETATH
jgi:peptide/nickel transport system ATP-binding protein